MFPSTGVNLPTLGFSLNWVPPQRQQQDIVSDGKFFLIGGLTHNSSIFPYVVSYQPEQQELRFVNTYGPTPQTNNALPFPEDPDNIDPLASPPNPARRYQHSTCLLNRLLLVFGGYATPSLQLGSIQDHINQMCDPQAIYGLDVDSQEWHRIEVLPSTVYYRPPDLDSVANSEPSLSRAHSVDEEGSSESEAELHEGDFTARSSPDSSQIGPAARMGHTCAPHPILQNDTVVMFGGYTATGIYSSELTTFCVNGGQGTWRTLPSQHRAPAGRSGHSAEIHEDSMIVFGGFDGRRCLGDLWRYNFKTKSWRLLAPESESGPPGRFGHASVVSRNSIFILGGRGTEGDDLNDLWRFSLSGSEEKWEYLTPQALAIPGGVFGAQARTLTEGHILIFGGVVDSGSSTFTVRGLDLNPESNNNNDDIMKKPLRSLSRPNPPETLQRILFSRSDSSDSMPKKKTADSARKNPLIPTVEMPTPGLGNSTLSLKATNHNDETQSTQNSKFHKDKPGQLSRSPESDPIAFPPPRSSSRPKTSNNNSRSGSPEPPSKSKPSAHRTKTKNLGSGSSTDSEALSESIPSVPARSRARPNTPLPKGLKDLLAGQDGRISFKFEGNGAFAPIQGIYADPPPASSPLAGNTDGDVTAAKRTSSKRPVPISDNVTAKLSEILSKNREKANNDENLSSRLKNQVNGKDSQSSNSPSTVNSGEGQIHSNPTSKSKNKSSRNKESKKNANYQVETSGPSKNSELGSETNDSSPVIIKPPKRTKSKPSPLSKPEILTSSKSSNKEGANSGMVEGSESSNGPTKLTRLNSSRFIPHISARNSGQEKRPSMTSSSNSRTPSLRNSGRIGEDEILDGFSFGGMLLSPQKLPPSSMASSLGGDLTQIRQLAERLPELILKDLEHAYEGYEKVLSDIAYLKSRIAIVSTHQPGKLESLHDERIKNLEKQLLDATNELWQLNQDRAIYRRLISDADTNIKSLEEQFQKQTQTQLQSLALSSQIEAQITIGEVEAQNRFLTEEVKRLQATVEAYSTENSTLRAQLKVGEKRQKALETSLSQMADSELAAMERASIAEKLVEQITRHDLDMNDGHFQELWQSTRKQLAVTRRSNPLGGNSQQLMTELDEIQVAYKSATNNIHALVEQVDSLSAQLEQHLHVQKDNGQSSKISEVYRALLARQEEMNDQTNGLHQQVFQNTVYSHSIEQLLTVCDARWRQMLKLNQEVTRRNRAVLGTISKLTNGQFTSAGMDGGLQPPIQASSLTASMSVDEVLAKLQITLSIDDPDSTGATSTIQERIGALKLAHQRKPINALDSNLDPFLPTLPPHPDLPTPDLPHPNTKYPLPSPTTVFPSLRALTKIDSRLHLHQSQYATWLDPKI